MRVQPMTPAWFDRLATQQEGYYYPWHSHLDPWHGEDLFGQLVEQHLQPDADVLEAACGHGELARAIAPHCRSVLAYDRTAPWIALAQEAAQTDKLTNVTFLCHDSSADANDGHARLPTAENTFDLLLCSKGPFHWIEDARRVARPGAVLLMLVPDATPLTPWHVLLPEPLRWKDAPADWARPAIEKRLTAAKLTIHSWWSFEVPETFADPAQLYAWLTWGCTPDEVPPFADVQPALAHIFATHASGQGLSIRRRRYMWKAVVPAD